MRRPFPLLPLRLRNKHQEVSNHRAGPLAAMGSALTLPPHWLSIEITVPRLDPPIKFFPFEGAAVARLLMWAAKLVLPKRCYGRWPAKGKGSLSGGQLTWTIAEIYIHRAENAGEEFVSNFVLRIFLLILWGELPAYAHAQKHKVRPEYSLSCDLLWQSRVNSGNAPER
jgi:hypothetical protein